MAGEAADLYQERAWLFVRDFERGKSLKVKPSSCIAAGQDAFGGSFCNVLLKQLKKEKLAFRKLTGRLIS